MNYKLVIWRQPGGDATGGFAEYELQGISGDMSFLEMLDLLNESLIARGERPVEFESDCREGICGSCGFMIDGRAHGPLPGTTTCQLFMRHFPDGATVVIEPFRARAFPVIRDLVVNRGALDRVISAGGYTSAKTGHHADGNATLISKDAMESALDSAACIGCGACVAACPNASAALFTGAKISHLAKLPQGEPLALERAGRMALQMDREGFGSCSNIGECEAACPKRISINDIARMRREYRRTR